MLFPVLLCLLFSAHHVRSEVNQGSPVEQNTKDSNDSRIADLEKTAKEYDNLMVDIMSVPSIRQGEEALQALCDQNGGNETYATASKAIKNIRKCFKDILGYAELPAKINKSKPYGELDTVFKEYCLKTDDIRKCVLDFLIEVDPCLAEHQRSGRFTVQRITDEVLRFVCENEGDHIALFISEKGPDCILSKQEGIKVCLDKEVLNNSESTLNIQDFEAMNRGTFNFSHESTIDERNKLFFSLELEQCRIAYRVRKCIVNELTTCQGSTPANVVDSIFNLIHNATQCAKYKMTEIDPEYNGGTSLSTAMFSIIIPALTVLLARAFNS